MSGPKIDAVTLRKMEQERLERERQERIKLLKSAITNYEKSVDLVRNEIKKIENTFSQDIVNIAEARDVKKIIQDFNIIKKKYVDCLSKLASKSMPTETNEIENQANIIRSEGAALFEKFNIESNVCQTLLNKYIDICRKNKESSDFHQQLKKSEKSDYGKIESVVWGLTDTYNESQNDINDEIDKLTDSINVLMDTEGILLNQKNYLIKIYRDIQEIQRNQDSLKSKAEKISKCSMEILQLKAIVKASTQKFKDCYNDYLSECFESGMIANDIQTFLTISSIVNETKRIRENANAKMVQGYIKQQVEEVMEKYGFNIVRSDYLIKDIKGIRELYEINFNTAINVYLSDENEVRMGIVGMGNDEILTEEENERLYQEQCAFCKMHPKIIKELEIRGVLFTEKKHYQPGKQYNQKILINSEKKKISKESDKRKSVFNKAITVKD